MSGVKNTRFILLSGPPGVGKTTIVRNFCNVLKDENIKAVGFYSLEVLNEAGKRIGFDIVTLDGKRGRLARTRDSVGPNDRSKFKIGNYLVFLNEFEDLVLPILSIRWMENAVFVIDEIGKMEMLSEEFVKLVAVLFTVHNIYILATIPVARGAHLPLIEQLINDPKNNVVNVRVKDYLFPILLEFVFIGNGEQQRYSIALYYPGHESIP